MSATTTSDTNTSTAKKTTTRKRTSSANATVVTPMAKKSNDKPRIAMFIDVDNVNISRENLLEILFYVNGKYRIEQCNLYGFNEDTLPGIKDIANDYNLVTIGKMKFKNADQNCLDSRLIVDTYDCAIKNAKNLDMIFVWCYPCDLTNLFEKIIDLGVSTATIDHRAFDCKNKFVTQAFKLYSQYDFDLDSRMYGQVQNLPENRIPDKSFDENPVQAVPTTTTPNPISAPTPTTQTTPTTAPTNSLDDALNGGVIPVLPRREIPERSPKPAANPNPNLDDKTQTDTTSAAEPVNQQAESIVDAISRKLNIQKPNSFGANEEFEVGIPAEIPMDENHESLLDMMEKAGFGKFGAGEPENYEDTIGDL